MRRTVTVKSDELARSDFALPEVALRSGPGRGLPGALAELPQLTVDTDYRLEPAGTTIAATSRFENTGAAPVTIWLGDVSTTTAPASVVACRARHDHPPSAGYAPDGRWIGMTGTDSHVYGLVYDDRDWTAYAAGIWVMSQRQVTIAPGGTYALTRRIVATAARGDGDPWSVLATI